MHPSLILFSALSFLGYALGCFFSKYTRSEFERYKLADQRRLVGSLQLLAVIGLLAGFKYPWMGQSAAGGLAVMMLVALMVRIRIKDSPLQMGPAALYLVLNVYLCLRGF